MFIAQEGSDPNLLDSYSVFAIGFIYTKGSLKDRADAIYTMFDTNGDGQLRKE